MAEGLRDSSSSLQKKKPPWLKLDIPVAPLLATAEEPASLQVPGRPARSEHCSAFPPTLQLLLAPERLGGSSAGLGNSLEGLYGSRLRGGGHLSSHPLHLAANALMPGHHSFAALEAPGLLPKCQHACGEQPLSCCLQRGTAACPTATNIHHPDHPEVSPRARALAQF